TDTPGLTFTAPHSYSTVKTIARGMPGDSGVTVVTNARAFYTTRAAAGASGARHSLRPLIGEGGKFTAKLGRGARRDREAVFANEAASANNVLFENLCSAAIH
ncbi:MAG TPA: hypothetical protein VGA15_23740, partial [Bradyrhizobium sp.]